MSHNSTVLNNSATSNDSPSPPNLFSASTQQPQMAQQPVAQQPVAQQDMSQALIVHDPHIPHNKPSKSQDELDLDDCKLGMNDFKGKIKDAIVKRHNGVYKSSLQAFTEAVESMDIDDATKAFLLNRVQHAMATNPDIKKKHGMISFSSSAYAGVLIDTLMECKKRTGAVYRNNTKHPLRSRPDKKQHFHPYANVGTKGNTNPLSKQQPHQTTLSAQPHQLGQSAITVHTLPHLQPSSIVNLDDPVVKQRIRNLSQMSKMTVELLDQYEALQDTSHPQNKEQLRLMVDNQLKCMHMSF